MRRLSMGFVLLLALPGLALAAKTGQLRIKLSPEIQGRLQGRLELTKGLLAKTYHTIDLASLTQADNLVNLPRKENLKNIKADLSVRLSTNLREGESEAFRIRGTIRPGDGFGGHELSILDENFDAKINCSNVFRSSKQGELVEIDLRGLRNLADCGGDAIAEYSPYGIGQRRIDDGSNWFSLADDERMGREYTEQFIAENRDKILPADHPTTRYMQEKMDLIARHSDMPNLRPKVRVINADVLNAFALPGGYVFVFRGLMEKSPSEAALMGVLGHEWAHVTARHGTRGMTRTLKTLTAAVTVMLITQVWAETTDDKVKQIILPLIGAGTVVGAQLRLLSKGREQELEADRIGSQYALLAGYHPRGIGDMFEVFKAESGGSSTSLEKILSSHPDHDTRIGRNHVLSALFYPSRPDYVSTSVGYEDALAALTGELLPPQSETVRLATAFVNGLQKQQEDIVTQHMKGFIGNMMEGRSQPAAR